MSWLNHTYRYYLWFFILVLFPSISVFPQESIQKENEVEKIFKEIETGITARDMSSLSDYFDDQTYLSLSNTSSGYYSINQVHYVLTDYFALYVPVSFHLENIVINSDQPYATGSFVFNKKGKRDSAVIYLSLKKNQESWKISQLSIN